MTYKEAGSFDVAVIGGGFPGICAAIAAARGGAHTILIERNGAIGGQAAEIDTWGLDGFLDTKGRLLIDGLPWEILRRTVAEGQSDPMWDRISMDTLAQNGIRAALEEIGLTEYLPYITTGTYMNPFNDTYINPEAYRYTALTMLQEAGVTVLLECPVIDVLFSGEGCIGGVVAQAAFEKFAIRAKRVVDCSQNAVVSACAGHPFAHHDAYMGTLTRVAGVDIMRLINYIRQTDENWFLRPMVGKRADPDEMERLVRGGNPLAIHGFRTALDGAVAQHPEFAPLCETEKSQLFFFYEQDGMGSYWTFGAGMRRVDTGSPFAHSQGILFGRRQQWLMHRFFRDYMPGFEHAYLTDTYGNISKAYIQSDEPGGLTEYEISPEERRTGRSERDDVLTVIRGHPYSGMNDDGWPIPLAALIPKGLDNLLVTGKPACRRIHYIASCAEVGEAAGAAAAVSVRENTPLRETDPEKIRRLLAGNKRG